MHALRCRLGRSDSRSNGSQWHPFLSLAILCVLEARYILERSLQGERVAHLLRYLQERGADEFSITVMALQDTLAPYADAFEDELGPYERPAAIRRGPRTAESVGVPRSIRLWTFNEASLVRLLSFMDTGGFHWPAGPDGWLEDLTIYRRGELVLGLVSSEREGVLRLTRQEHAEVVALGIASQSTAEGIEY